MILFRTVEETGMLLLVACGLLLGYLSVLVRAKEWWQNSRWDKMRVRLRLALGLVTAGSWVLSVADGGVEMAV